jgi:amino acid transporter
MCTPIGQPHGEVAVERAESSTGLAREAIGLREVLFQSITHMAPAAAVAFSIPAGALFAAGALPLSVLLALVGCLLVAISIGQLAKHLPSAGSFYTYTARGLHPSVGFLVAWGYSIVEPLVAPLLYLIFGHVVATVLQQEFGWRYSQWWWVAALAAAVFVFILGYFGIKISARTGTVLGIFEIGVFAVLAVWLIVKAGDANTFSVFGKSFATTEGFEGASGVVAGSIFTILAFIGFEAAAPLAEETLNPRRNIQRAVIYSCLGIGIFYVVTTYAAVVFFGPERFGEFPTSGGGNPWDALAKAVWGAGWVVVFLAIANSAIANSNAAANAATRTWYAMGRIRLFPPIFAHVHPRYRSPDFAVFMQFLVGVGLSLWLGAKYGPFPTAFLLVATIDTAIIVAIYMLVDLACLFFYVRERRDEFNWFVHGVLPIAGILAFALGFMTAVGIGAPIVDAIGLEGLISPLPSPLNLVGPVDGIAMGVGLVYLIILYIVKPERIRDTGRIFIEEGPAEAPETVAPV